jgi:Cu-Zn family superoxide dismutase
MIKTFRIAAVSAALTAVPAMAATMGPIGGDLVGPGNSALGKVTVTDAPKGVILHIEATGLTPGWHGAHFHEKGVCNDEGFKLSGSHIHPGKMGVHGLLNPNASDFGDLPNIYVAADGTANVELFSTLVSVGGAGKRPALSDADGSALVIHASPDDYMTQPIGGAGARVACAVIK